MAGCHCHSLPLSIFMLTKCLTTISLLFYHLCCENWLSLLEYWPCLSCCLASLPTCQVFYLVSLFTKYFHSSHSNTAAMFTRSFGNFGNFDSKTSTRQLSNGGMASQIESYWFTIILTKIITAGLLTVCCICIDSTTRISGGAGLAS